MSLFIRLSTVVVTVVLLRCVSATLVITAPSTVTESTAITPGQPLTCPAASDYSISGTTSQVAGQEYLRTTVNESRLSLSDVQTRVVNGSNIQSLDVCARAASNDGNNAFSFVSGTCKQYYFKKSFCPCVSGNLDIYINTKLLGQSKELVSEKLGNGNIKKIVIYTEIPLVNKELPSDVAALLKDSSQCASQFSVSYYHSGAFVDNNQCYFTQHHDFASCNQTCRGQPVDVFVMKVNPLPTLPILSLCGQKIAVPIINTGQGNQAYFSHAGFGCYRYQGTMTAGGEDCIVTFIKDTKGMSLTMFIAAISLNSEGSTCHDNLSIYDGKTTADTSRKFNGCSGPQTFVSSKAAITIKFHRGLGSEKNIGFKLLIGNF